jgi:hypothetical protein
MVAKKVSFAEAEEEDDLFWSKSTAEENLTHLYELRKAFYDFDEIEKENGRFIKKVVNVISRNEE